MSPVDLFNVVTEQGSYRVGYLADGWTHEIEIKARCPAEAMVRVQNVLGGIWSVTFVEKGYSK